MRWLKRLILEIIKFPFYAIFIIVMLNFLIPVGIDKYYANYDIDYDCKDFYSNNIKIKNNDIFVQHLKFDKESYICLRNKLNKKSTLNIYESPGGQMVYADALLMHLESNKIPIKVYSRCVSACANTIIRSSTSNVCNTAKIGIHQTGFKSDIDILDEVYNEYLSHYFTLIYVLKFKGYEFDYEHFKDKLLKTPFKSVYFFSNEELKKHNYAKNFSECKHYQFIKAFYF